MKNEGHRFILVFIDGFGVGSNDDTINPLAAGELPSIAEMAGGSLPTLEAAASHSDTDVYRAIDANLGVVGLPQSGTGQATLFTGVNCARLAGRHYGPFPHSSSRSVIREKNLFKLAAAVSGADSVFANAYPERFFRYIDRTQRWTVTTLCCSEAGVRLRTGDDLRNDEAVSADITGSRWPEPDSGHTVITHEQAGRRLVELSEGSPLTVFEYFETDKAGHAQDLKRSRAALEAVDGLLGGVLDALEPDQTLVVTSDHGNIEDLSTRTHTRNPVPLLVRGPAAHYFSAVDSLISVAPAIMSAIAEGD